MQKLLLALFCFSYLLSHANCAIKIVGPDTFVTWADEHQGWINSYALADFGYIPYGRTLYGVVQVANPHQACSGLTLMNSAAEMEQHPIIVADRGGCHYVRKAQNAQLAGAKLLIVVDTSVETDYATYSMGDDGHGVDINIPTILVHKKFGDKIKEYAALNATVTLSVTFDDPPQNEKVDLEIWLANTNNNSIVLLQNMKPWIEKIYDLISFVPHYPIYSTTDPEDLNCVAKGKYCSPDPDGEGPLNGRDIIQEDLRELALFYGWSPNDWWTYVTSLNPSCMNTVEMHSCSYDVIQGMGINLAEFLLKQHKLNGVNESDNELLAKEAASKRSHVPSPGIVINGMIYRGNVQPASHVFAAICEGFTEMPASCSAYMDSNSTGSTTTIYKKRSVKYILAVCVVGLLVLAFFLFCCYKRYLKKQIAKELSLKANTAVSEYFAMHEAGERDTKGLIEMKSSA